MSIRKQYDTDLESLKNSLTEMGRNSADAVENALEALCVADADAAAAIVKGDARINNMERDIEHRCMTLLLRQQPVAGDLRRISTAMKVVTDIERIGDHAADIAEIIPHLVTVRKEGDPAVSQAIAMGKKAHQMILKAYGIAAVAHLKFRVEHIKLGFDLFEGAGVHHAEFFVLHHRSDERAGLAYHHVRSVIVPEGRIIRHQSLYSPVQYHIQPVAG